MKQHYLQRRSVLVLLFLALGFGLFIIHSCKKEIKLDPISERLVVLS